MSLESDLFAVLKPFATTAGSPPTYRVFPDTAPALTPTPYIVYQQAGGQVLNPLDNSAPGLRNARMVIRVWSNKRTEAVSINDQIEDAMRSAPGFKARPQAAKFNDYDEDLKLYSSEQEYSIWY